MNRLLLYIFIVLVLDDTCTGVTKMGGHPVSQSVTPILVKPPPPMTKMGVANNFRFVFTFLDGCDC